MVHVDDLADGFVRAAESDLYGEIFNFADEAAPIVREMVMAIALAAYRQSEVQYVRAPGAERTMGAMPEALALDLAVYASKAARLLDWRPRHRGFLAEVNTYLSAWRAAHASEPVRRAA